MMITKEKEPRPLLYRNPIREFKGYTLFSPLESKEAYLIDLKGRIAHKWSLPLAASYNMEILENGNLLYMGKVEDGPMSDFEGCGGKLIELDWDSNPVWEYTDPYMHHTFYRRRNGNILFAKWVKTPDEAINSIKGGIEGTEKDGIMWSDAIIEVDKYGYVVYQWKAYEHLDREKHIICPLDHRTEWTRANSIYEKENGNILVNFMMTHSAAEIEKETGKVLWDFTGELAHAHSISEVAGGNFMLFDNGLHTIYIGFSRIIEVDPRSMKIVWEYKEDSIASFYSSILGGCQRLGNGNTLICDSSNGRIVEVTPEKEVIWEYVSPYYHDHNLYGHSNIIIDAKRYPPEYPAFKDKDWLF